MTNTIGRGRLTDGAFASSGGMVRWRMQKLSIITDMKNKGRLKPVHPGDVLKEDFLKPLKLSANAVARAVGVSPIAISQIARGRRAVSPEMALKLGRYFNVSPELWLGLQADYDLEVARVEMESRIMRDVEVCPLLQTT